MGEEITEKHEEDICGENDKLLHLLEDIANAVDLPSDLNQRAQEFLEEVEEDQS